MISIESRDVFVCFMFTAFNAKSNPMVVAVMIIPSLIARVGPGYIHLCKCWSLICSGKVIKKYRNTWFSYKLFYSFLLPIDKTQTSAAKVCRGYSAKSVKMSFHACHAVKTAFPGNFPKFSNIQENLWKSPDYITCLFFKCLQNSAKYTGWRDYRLYCTAIVLTLHRWNILIIFKQLTVNPFLQEDLTPCFSYFQFRKNGEHTFS